MEAAARFKRELYGEYGYFYYVPMAESRTVQLPVMSRLCARKNG